MLKEEFRREASPYFILMVLIAISLPFSKFTLTLFEILLLLFWAAHGVRLQPFSHNGIFLKRIWQYLVQLLLDFGRSLKMKMRLFFDNPVALGITSLFLLHIIGLSNTSDFAYAWKDIRTKLPLLILPLVMASMPRLSQVQTNVLRRMFVLAVFVGTLISIRLYLKRDFDDIRDISPFISSVRFALMVVFSFFLLLIEIFSSPKISLKQQLFLTLPASWFIVYLIILESVIGILSVFIILLILLMRLIFRSASWRTKLVLFVFAILFFIGSMYYVAMVSTRLTTHKPLDISKLDKLSKLGNVYRHDTIHFGVENGRYVGIYFAEEELSQAWNQRSHYDFYGRDDAGQLIMYTIIRYLTSADLRKDAEGVAALSTEDIRHIENGIANREYITKPGLSNRISKIITGYQQSIYMNDPSGSSFMQRIEHLKASLMLIQKHFWWGVGTGDIPDAFRQIYDEMNSRLKPEVRWRSHNQYLSIWIGFGVFGFIGFVGVLVFLLLYRRAYLNVRFFVFWLIMVLSMFSEDTLETQIGVTLFAFFFCFFCLAANADTSVSIQTIRNPIEL
ncbi:hypothetical protein MASR2M12_03910 [Bacteroidales bacterium]